VAALQESGNKTSRDAIAGSFRAFTKICYQRIELMRQFYTETRYFRVTGEDGRSQFVKLNNSGLQGKPILGADGQPVMGADGVPTQDRRKPVFDIVVKAARKTAYTKASNNQMMLEFFQMGFFNPELAEQALACVDMLDFEGKEQMRQRIEQNQTMFGQLQQLSQENAQLKAMMGMGGGAQEPVQGAAMPRGNGNPAAATAEAADQKRAAQ
jgi:hypothetical protein